jgi:hypothetical protein
MTNVRDILLDAIEINKAACFVRPGERRKSDFRFFRQRVSLVRQNSSFSRDVVTIGRQR